MTTETLAPSAAPQKPLPSAPRDRSRRRHGVWPRVRSVLKHVGLILVAFVMIYPVLWLVLASLRPDELIFREPGLVFRDLSFDNYVEGWNSLASPFGVYLLNTALIVIGCIVGNLVSCSMAAYAFARVNFAGRRVFFAMMLLTIMLPVHVIIVPQYILFSQFGWVNTFIPLILPKFLAVDAFFVFLMVQFIRGIPKELDEAARIDGAGHLRIFVQVILPLMIPALATTTIFTFIWTWNGFFEQLIYLTSEKNYTTSLALQAFQDAEGSTSFGSMFAMSVVSLLPVFFVFLFGQKYLLRGIATTGLK